MEKQSVRALSPDFNREDGYDQEIWDQRFLLESALREHRLSDRKSPHSPKWLPLLKSGNEFRFRKKYTISKGGQEANC